MTYIVDFLLSIILLSALAVLFRLLRSRLHFMKAKSLYKHVDLSLFRAFTKEITCTTFQQPVIYFFKKEGKSFSITVSEMVRNCGLFHLSGLSFHGGTSEERQNFLNYVLSKYTNSHFINKKAGTMFIFTIKKHNARMLKFATRKGAKKLASYDNATGSQGLELWSIVLK